MYAFAVDEEDVFQCGKCKREFSNLSLFLGHKQNQCVVPERTSATTSSVSTIANVHSAGMTSSNVIYTAHLAHPQPNKQITVMSLLSYTTLIACGIVAAVYAVPANILTV